jgi:disulfide bond formation protein DsbB
MDGNLWATDGNGRRYPMWENRAMRHMNRAVFAFIVVACVTLDAYAIVHLQEALGLEPCPMCILSRYAFIAIAVVSLVAAIHGPRGTALRVYGGLVALFAAIGIGISARHSWLQHNPPKIDNLLY